MAEHWNILMITNHIFPELNANSEIAYKLAEVLEKEHRCKVRVMGYLRHRQEKNDAEEPFQSILLPDVTKGFGIWYTAGSPVKKFMALLRFPKALRFILRYRKEGERALKKEYKKAIRATIQKERFDCIVGFSEPCVLLEALSEIETDIPVISYKLDPWSTNYTRAGDNSARMNEEKSDRQAAAIIETALIHNEIKDKIDPTILGKTYVAELPCMASQDYTPHADVFDGDRVHCVFAGGFYKDIRNPEYMVKLFNAVEKEGVVLHVFSDQNPETLCDAKMSGNIVFHGRVDSAKAIEYMQAADFLVNIGNAINNQMPSKILSYISLRKPIINLAKSIECPTLRYLEKYPLALNIFETKELKPEDADRLIRFCLENKGKTVPKNYVDENYQDCTPSFVGKQLYETICKVIEKSK